MRLCFLFFQKKSSNCIVDAHAHIIDNGLKMQLELDTCKTIAGNELVTFILSQVTHDD